MFILYFQRLWILGEILLPIGIDCQLMGAGAQQQNNLDAPGCGLSGWAYGFLMGVVNWHAFDNPCSDFKSSINFDILGEE
jgi:hypothetical protein